MEGGRSYYEEDPRRWINFTLGLHAGISVCEGNKNGGRTYTLGPSAIFTGVNNYLSFVVVSLG